MLTTAKTKLIPFIRDGLPLLLTILDVARLRFTTALFLLLQGWNDMNLVENPQISGASAFSEGCSCC